MWDVLLEWCADMFGVTTHGRLLHLFAGCAAVIVLGVMLGARWGVAGWLPTVVLVTLAVLTARQVAVARDEVWRAACLPITEEEQRPDVDPDGRVIAPTAATLYHLAQAVDAVRRGRYAIANELVPRIQRRLLRAEEAQLLDAVRAMISMGLGSSQRAAQQAIVALPTGSEDLDTCLGRTVVADAWRQPERLRAIHSAWERAGVRENRSAPLARLHDLVRLRVEPALVERVRICDAKDLAEEARAIGDDELASELDARSRTAYR